MVDPTYIELVAVVLGPAGAAWIGVKTAVNGLRGDVSDIKRDVHELKDSHNNHGNRLTAIETKLEVK